MKSTSSIPAPEAESRCQQSERGSVTVEFALVVPILVLMIVMVIDFGRAYNYWIDTTHLASEGARLAAVGKAPGDDLVEYIRQQANTAELRDGGSDSVEGKLVVCLSYPDPDGGSVDNPSPGTGDPVKVRVSTAYNWIPLVGNEFDLSAAEISGSATHRLETSEPLDDGCTETG
jgi:Flp pilus assembly protein TadG